MSSIQGLWYLCIHGRHTLGDRYFLGANRVRSANLAIRAAIACLANAETRGAVARAAPFRAQLAEYVRIKPPTTPIRSLAAVSQTVPCENISERFTSVVHQSTVANMNFILINFSQERLIYLHAWRSLLKCHPDPHS